jgi:hypothetical protein
LRAWALFIFVILSPKGEKEMKKTLSIVLAVLMIVTTIPIAFAADIVASGNCGANGGNVKWTLDSDGLLTISGEGEISSYKPFSDYCNSIITVIIENGVTVIPDFVFESCVNLRKVNLPSSLTSIGMSAFWCCKSLAEINLPSSLTSIGGYAFGYCESLKEITIPDGITTIEQRMFTSCEGLEKIILPNSLKTIAQDAFYITNLSDIYYIGTADEWNEVEIQGKYTIHPSNYQMHYCTRVVASDNICDKNGANNGMYCSDCNKYFPGHDWTKGDGVCANGCGYECPHEEFVEPYLIYDSSSGGFYDEGAENLFDAKNDTKWCSKFYGEASVVFHYSDKVIINSYTLTPAEDTVNFPTRNWMSWDLYGSDTETGEWTHIHTVTNIILPAEKESAPFTVNADTAYKYYKIVIKDIREGDTQQMAGINIEIKIPWPTCLTCGYICSIHTTEEDTNKANCIHGDICDICGIEYGVKNNNHDWSNKDGVCANGCGAECTHEDAYNNLIRPVQNADGTWGKGKIVKICNTCGNSSLVREVERDHEGYEALEEAAAELEALLNSDELISGTKTTYTNYLNHIKMVASSMVYTEIETELANMVADINRYVADIEAGLADGTMRRADLSYMTSLFNEVNAIINGDASLIIPSEVGKYWSAYYYYQSQLNNSNYSQKNYDDDMINVGYENQLETLLAGLKDGTMLKADYTAIDEAIAELDEKLADENLTDEAKAGLEEIKADLEEMKKNPITSKADLAVLEKALEDYETEVDAGIEDGSAVKVDGLGELVAYLSPKEQELKEKYGETEYLDVLNSMSDEAEAERADMVSDALSLTGSLKDNEDELAELKGRMDALLVKIENCLNGTHEGLKYEITEDAECGKNAVESATCTFCGEVLEREIEDTALTHSFTKYEVTEEAKCGIEGKEVAYCDNGCGETDEKAIEALRHSFTKYEVTEEAKCGIEGKEVAYCDNGCGETDEKAIEALTHKDADGDYKCDNGCGHEFEKPAPEEPTPDTPDEPTYDACDHLCHKGGFMGFIWKIVKFFSKLFKINPVCECGAAHY